MCVTICGRFRSDEGVVAGYGNRIRVKYTAKWGVQIAGMIFQTRSNNFTLVDILFWIIIVFLFDSQMLRKLQLILSKMQMDF